MKKLIATLFLICTAAAAMAQSSFNGRPLWTTQAVERATLERKAVAWFSQENLDFNLFSTKAGRPHGIAAAEVRWEIAAATNVDVVYLRVTGTVVGAFTNVAHFDVSPSNSSLTAGSYRGFIRALQYSSGGDLTNSVVLQDQAITVYAAVDPDGSPELGPQQSYVRSVNGQQPDGTGDVALSATASDGLTAQFTGTALAIGQTNLATLQQIANATQRTEQVYGETMAAYALASNAYDAAQSAQSIATSAQATASSVEDIAVAGSNLAAAAYAIATNATPIARFEAATNDMHAALTNESAARLQLEQDFYNQLSSITLSGGVSVVMGGGWYASEYVCGLEATPIFRGLAASNASVASLDWLVDRHYAEGGAIDFQMSPSFVRNDNNAPYQWSAWPTNVASINSNGLARSLAVGQFTVRLDVGASSAETNLTADISTNLVYDYQLLGPTNYLRRAMLSELYWRGTSNLNPRIFSSFSHAQTSYVWSTTGLLQRINITAFPVWWSRYGDKRMGGALITPLHVLTTEHYQPIIGDRVRFVTTNNIVVERTVVAQSPVSISNGWSDAVVNQLDAPVTNIAPIKTPSRIITYYLTSIEKYPYASWGINIPVVTIQQYSVARIAEMRSWGRGYRRANEPWWNDKYQLLIVGDSGSPVFCLIDDEPLFIGLVTVNTWDSASVSFPNAFAETAVNAAIRRLGSNYAIEQSTNNLSRYTPLLPVLP